MRFYVLTVLAAALAAFLAVPFASIWDGGTVIRQGACELFDERARFA